MPAGDDARAAAYADYSALAGLGLTLRPGRRWIALLHLPIPQERSPMVLQVLGLDGECTAVPEIGGDLWVLGRHTATRPFWGDGGYNRAGDPAAMHAATQVAALRGEGEALNGRIVWNAVYEHAGGDLLEIYAHMPHRETP